jgi:hypothetical protein
MRWLLALVLISFFSCQQKTQKFQAGQLNFDSLLEHHINFLSKNGASLEKKSTVNETVNTSQVSTDVINWSSELEAFRILGVLNKPIHSGEYQIVETPDSKSNLIVKTWTAKTAVPVRLVRILYLDQPNMLKKLEAEVEQTNFVFSSSKKLTLEFNVLGGVSVAERYEISGSQSFFWGPPQYYSLAGLIRVK